jgi:hypothetical protein
MKFKSFRDCCGNRVLLGEMVEICMSKSNEKGEVEEITNECFSGITIKIKGNSAYFSKRHVKKILNNDLFLK